MLALIWIISTEDEKRIADFLADFYDLAFIRANQATPVDQRWHDLTERITGYGMGVGVPW